MQTIKYKVLYKNHKPVLLALLILKLILILYRLDHLRLNLKDLIKSVMLILTLLTKPILIIKLLTTMNLLSCRKCNSKKIKNNPNSKIKYKFKIKILFKKCHHF